MTTAPSRRPVLRRTAVAAVLLAAVTACTAEGPADRSGGDVVRLRFATIDGPVGTADTDPGPQTFIDQLAEVSGGRLRVQVSANYGAGAGSAESKLLRDIASGELDGGWPATRAFAGAGIPGMAAVEAPLTLTSYAAMRDLVRGPAAATVADRALDAGVVILGLAVGELRHPFAVGAPLLAPADWRGARFRIYNSPVEAEVVRALGGSPVNLGHVWRDQVRAGTLRGADVGLVRNAPSDFGGHVTANVVLWPKVYALTLNRARFHALPAQHQRWVRTAAERAVRASLADSFDDSRDLGVACEQGLQVVLADGVQLAALRTAVAPVIEAIAADPAEAPLLELVQAAAARHPETEVASLPIVCTQDQPAPEIPAAAARLPDGTYRVAIARAEVAAAKVSNDSGWSGIWTLRVHEGEYALTCRPYDTPKTDCGGTVSDKPLEVGQLRGAGDVAYFVLDVRQLARVQGCRLPATGEGDHCTAYDPYWVRWSLDGRTLTFPDSSGSQFSHHLTIKPWEQIG